MTRNLAARIERLEAAKQSPSKVRGIVGGLPETHVEEIDGVLHLRRPETPTGEAFAPWAERQQAELQEQLRDLGDTEDPQEAEAPPYVGNERLAPLPAGKKRPRYLEIHGREIDAFNIKELKSCR